MESNIRSDDETKDILILGGSVVSSSWSRLEMRLDTILSKRYPGKHKFSIYNIAMPGHTSLDNWLKYEMLNSKRFDLVIYYEAINENRANNIPAGDFQSDYSHMKWYEDIYMLQAHPEMNISVIPFLIHKVVKGVRDKLKRKIYIEYNLVNSQYVPFGSDIKTAACYERNVARIIQSADRRGDKLLLVSYASFFPKGVRLTGVASDNKHFAGCQYVTPVTLWGSPVNVRKGIRIHNAVLRKLVDSNRTYYLDMAKLLPREKSLFCDVCHLSELGAQKFANELGEYLITEKIFN